MSEKTAVAAAAPVKKASVVDTFLKGCVRGFKVGIENITPAMILGYTLVYILQATGLMDLLGTVFAPVMGLFGLPGEAFAVLISAFFAKASGCATAATMYAAGTLTLGQASMLLPACILIPHVPAPLPAHHRVLLRQAGVPVPDLRVHPRSSGLHYPGHRRRQG